MTRRPKAAFAMTEGLQHRLFDSSAKRELEGLVELVDESAWTAAREPHRFEDVEVLISFWGSPAVDDDILRRLPDLRAIFHAGGSVKAVVGTDVWAREITVTTSADANAEPVARFALGLILLAGKDAIALSRQYERGEYTLGDNPRLGSHESTVGIIGASRTGRALIRLLLPLGYRVLLTDPYVDEAAARALGVEAVPLDELLRTADIVSLNAPDLPATRGMLGAREFALMRDGACFINTARPGLVVTDALHAELASGRLRAMLDVTDPEPLPAGHPLFSMPNVFVTPHLAGAQGSELRLLGQSVLEEVARYVADEPPLRPVGRDEIGRSA